MNQMITLSRPDQIERLPLLNISKDKPAGGKTEIKTRFFHRFEEYLNTLPTLR